jgi:hypothetical protein
MGEQSVSAPRAETSLASYIPEVVASPAALAQLEVGAFPGKSPVVSRSSRLEESILSILADGKPWRSKHLVERVAADGKAIAIHTELAALWKAGRISKLRNGVWMLAGLPEPSADEIPPLRPAQFRGPTGRKVWNRLSTAASAPTLVKELGVTRQRIDQILKTLLEQETVTRLQVPGARRRWLWIRSDVCANDALRYCPPPSRDRRAAVLNALEPDALHFIDDVVQAVGEAEQVVREQIRKLECSGLVVSIRLGRTLYVGITPCGLDDPCRSPSAARSPTADLSEAFADKRVACLETLAVLGEATTIEVSAGLANSESLGTDVTSSRSIAQLIGNNLADVVPGHSGPRPTYRLTEAGRRAASLLANHRAPPGKEQTEARIASFRAQWKQRMREIAHRCIRAGIGAAVPGSPAQRAILEALADGPKSSASLARVIADLGRSPTSLQWMLQTLRDRGAIRSIGKQDRLKVWSLVDAQR